MCKYCEGHKTTLAESDFLSVTIALLPKAKKLAVEIPPHWKCKKRGCMLVSPRSMSANINYCPMCGQELREEAES